MDLSAHRTILYLGLKRAQERLTAGNLNNCYQPLWLGNWLTDMNQASCFFDVLEGGYKDPYEVWAGGAYAFASTIQDHRVEWTNLFRALWKHEWARHKSWPKFHGFNDVGAQPLSADDIGGYFPYDHFDTVDRHNMQGRALDAWEFENSSATLMTRTAHDGVFTQCLWRQLNPVFSEPLERRSRTENLRTLGYALHTLQDYFAHSNHVELLLRVFSERSLLDADLAEAIRTERFGCFASYTGGLSGEDTPVMTGRFDRIDTVSTIVKMYRLNLVPRWQDLTLGGYRGQVGKTRDLLFDVLFGTFSNQPFVPEAVHVLKDVLEVKDFLGKVSDSIHKGVVNFFGSVAKLFTNDDTDRQIDEVKDLLLVLNSAEAKDWANAGRLLYVEHVLEEKLRTQLADATWRPQLPHHTLLAKDADAEQPEVRLAFKLACCIATDVTTAVLEAYFRGASLADMEAILHRYYRHPTTFIADDGFKKSLNVALKELYGVRWYLLADCDSNQIAVPGI